LGRLEFAQMERPSVRITSLVAFAIVLATVVLYIVLINAQSSGQPDPTPYIPRFVASFLAVMAALVALALLPRPEVVPIRVPMRAAAAAGLLGLGLLAAMSIGLPLVVAGILVGIALGRTSQGTRSRLRRLAGLGAAVAALAVLFIGLNVAQRTIVCPASGPMSGGGTGLFGDTYHYDCNNGELHMTFWQGT